ncbi:MAG: hypothetical protein ACI9XO_000558 [Paraglaciecola sp.]|jgi:hypothetical protein
MALLPENSLYNRTVDFSPPIDLRIITLWTKVHCPVGPNLSYDFHFQSFFQAC